jgi:hypothetical protein
LIWFVKVALQNSIQNMKLRVKSCIKHLALIQLLTRRFIICIEFLSVILTIQIKVSAVLPILLTNLYLLVFYDPNLEVQVHYK